METTTESQTRVDATRAAILVSPLDTTSRHAFADALEENEEFERAAEQREILARNRRRWSHVAVRYEYPEFVAELVAGKAGAGAVLYSVRFSADTAGSRERLARAQALATLRDFAAEHGWIVAPLD